MAVSCGGGEERRFERHRSRGRFALGTFSTPRLKGWERLHALFAIVPSDSSYFECGWGKYWTVASPPLFGIQ